MTGVWVDVWLMRGCMAGEWVYGWWVIGVWMAGGWMYSGWVAGASWFGRLMHAALRGWLVGEWWKGGCMTG